MSTNYWPADAVNINLKETDIERYVAKTSKVADFFDGGRFIVSGPKGYGKTLLLKYVYQEVRDKYEGEGYLSIPFNTPLDSFNSSLAYDEKKLVFLQDSKNWSKLWYVAIGLSIVLNYSQRFDDFDFLESFYEKLSSGSFKLEGLDTLIRTYLAATRNHETVRSFIRAQANPSALLELICSSTQSKLNSSLDWLSTCIHQFCISVDKPIFVFIDQVDQGISEFPVKIWQSAQVGLVSAIFRHHTANRHIRLYASIRKEAWDGCQDELATQYEDLLCDLSYTPAELKQIFCHAIKTFENPKTVVLEDEFSTNPIFAFTGMESIKNTWAGSSEEVFSYILRHTLGRPRDLMSIGKAIHELNQTNDLTHESFVQKVNEIPSIELSKQYFKETARFSTDLSKGDKNYLFSLIKKNVLSGEELVDICSMYNSNVRCLVKEGDGSCHSCQGAAHIFCDLYRVGLLGVVGRNPAVSGCSVQHFELAGRVNSTRLPESSSYLIHPAMDYYISTDQQNKKYEPVKGLVVGHNCSWLDKYDLGPLIGMVDELIETLRAESCELNVINDLQSVKELLEKERPEYEECQGELMKLQSHVSSKGMLDASQFVTNIMTTLEIALKGLA